MFEGTKGQAVSAARVVFPDGFTPGWWVWLAAQGVEQAAWASVHAGTQKSLILRFAEENM